MFCKIKIYCFLSLHIIRMFIRVIKTRRIRWATEVARVRTYVYVRLWWTNLNEKDRLEYLRLYYIQNDGMNVKRVTKNTYLSDTFILKFKKKV
jgi:hypothetical protein